MENHVEADEPRRITGTRCKINDVLRAYLSEVWWCTGRRTWKWQWNENDFNKKYERLGSDAISPAQAVRIALREFYLKNKAEVNARLPSSR